MARRTARMLAGGAGLAALLVAVALPVVAQKGPTSLLPPGFGEEEPAPTTPAPAPGDAPGAAPATPAGGTAGPRPALQLDLSDIGGPGLSDAEPAMDNAAQEALSPEELAEQAAKYDLPDTARRSLSRIGPLTDATGGVPSDAFGQASGRFLANVLRETRAPLASRWGSILLRRVLLSATDTPDDIDGADWAAERAWLLVRMGEADAARMMVQSVDTDRYTRRLYSVAMQAYLAAADPVGLCPLYEGAQRYDATPGWVMAEAVCASMNGEQGTASALLNQAQRRGRVRGIDYRLTEKLVGAGLNSRRSVKIEWEGVDTLTAWRFGLATAVNVDIPAPLLDASGGRVAGWLARAPMRPLSARLAAAETATRMGVFSGAALVDFYAALAASEDAPDTFRPRAMALADAYRAQTVGARIDAMRRLWVTGGGDTLDYAGLIAVARAAASLPVADADPADTSHLIAAMLSAGYDESAARWAQASGKFEGEGGALGWALLAVGAPRIVVDISPDRASSFARGNGLRGRMLLAALAGMGRISMDDARDIGEEAGVSFVPRSRWSRAIDAAARRGERGTVAVLAAVGMQTGAWAAMPPEHVYHIVAALHRVGLNPEARMIAAEAVMRT